MNENLWAAPAPKKLSKHFFGRGGPLGKETGPNLFPKKPGAGKGLGFPPTKKPRGQPRVLKKPKWNSEGLIGILHRGSDGVQF
uniref:Putative antimicrobial peptide 7848 n=1 Tax=Urodacus yaschenkoi TaxID=1273102 RepID=NDB4_UROYA|nr:RecName: Full=Putative antimicrobial peptide 7848; Short=Uy7848; Flags: Precursor [Urodacus yaschenkoi]AGA82765.1 putative antmicrobial peptide 7848 [Urodacus yaschenkoi]